MSNKSRVRKISNYISISKAADIIETSRAAIYQAHKRGSLIFYSIGGRNFLKHEDILKYKKNRKVGRPSNKSKRNKKK